ncbi:hypothetical protein L1887_02613 [Cichorium endivia]|nr:hypothetical protein L1887_02613 [Cichorium endivia]
MKWISTKEWDAFDKKDIQIALDEVLQYKQEFNETTVNPRDKFKEASGRRSRRRFLPKRYDELMNKGKSFGTQTYKSLAVSNAIGKFN